MFQVCLFSNISIKLCDQNAIDLDQKMIMDTLVSGSTAGLGPALAVYEKGAHSEPIARLFLSPQLTGSLTMGAIVEGFNIAGTDEVFGTLIEGYGEGTVVIEVAYNISSSQSTYVKCQVGGSPYPVTEGCTWNVFLVHIFLLLSMLTKRSIYRFQR
jgi:hypothetical protein